MDRVDKYGEILEAYSGYYPFSLNVRSQLFCYCTLAMTF